MAWQCYRTGGRGERKTSAWDMMRLGLRELGGGGEKEGMSFWWHSRFGLPWETRGHERRGDHHSTEDKGRERVSVLIFMCVCVCVASAHHASYSTTHNDSPPSALQSMSRLPIEMTAGQWEPILSPCEPIRSEQWQGKLCHHEMHS